MFFVYSLVDDFTFTCMFKYLDVEVLFNVFELLELDNLNARQVEEESSGSFLFSVRPLTLGFVCVDDLLYLRLYD